MVQDIKGAESGPVCLRLTVILLECLVLLTDDLAYLWRGDRLVLPSPYYSRFGGLRFAPSTLR